MDYPQERTEALSLEGVPLSSWWPFLNVHNRRILFSHVLLAGLLCSSGAKAGQLCETVHRHSSLKLFLNLRMTTTAKGLPEGWRAEPIRNAQGEKVGSTQPMRVSIPEAPSLVWKKHRRPGQGAAEVAAAAVARALAVDWIPETEFRPGVGARALVPETFQSLVTDGFTEMNLQNQVAQRLNLFDYVIGNRDRNLGNVIISGMSGSMDGIQWKAIDHGQAFQVLMAGQWGQPSRLEQLLQSSPLPVDLVKEILDENPYLERLAGISEPRWRDLLAGQGLGPREIHFFLRRRDHVLMLWQKALSRL